MPLYEKNEKDALDRFGAWHKFVGQISKSNIRISGLENQKIPYKF